MKKSIISISKVILSVATIPLWLVKIFVGVGHLPDENTGEIVEVVFRHSMFENIGDLVHPALAYTAMVIALFSAAMNGLILRFVGELPQVVKTIANIAFWVAMGTFLLLLLLASTVSRGY